ncbi:pentatricopeptide repeat-containing protein 1, mitochondrial [Amyelois transitella]|uniref:pentatricopeptide repeat-containing protein 1, mitochondrial n=1 Tax=Amyelois transitella TaxID=680683 RepID=UPI00298F7FDA|nr:pentatricopeptide repeat-containing protein 1, mitochondrial [Amyelois transitella]
MAFRCLKLLRVFRQNCVIHRNLPSVATSEGNSKFSMTKEYRTEDNLKYFGDPDTFGTLSRKINYEEEVTDEGDILEEKYIQNVPLSSQKLTTRQYADIIKQYLSNKRIKEAIDVLEKRILIEDRVKPENYIYNILIGACADVGFTKKAFKLYNDMKRRAIQPTGDTYTCLFNACAKSPFPSYGLKQAQNLRSLMLEKKIEPNITNYNAMIKAFAHCGDLSTAFGIVDEMKSKKIKIRIHTLNHLLHACISDKNSGLRHALVVWRKMLKLREKPNIYSFNLMLKCVKECNLGSKEDIEQLLEVIHEHFMLHGNTGNKLLSQEVKEIENAEIGIKLIPSENIHAFEENNKHEASKLISVDENKVPVIQAGIKLISSENIHAFEENNKHEASKLTSVDENKVPVIQGNDEKISLKFIHTVNLPVPLTQIRTVPNLLSKNINMNQVLALQEVHTLQDKFAVLGGQDDFLKEMEVYSVKPDIKTFTQMLPLIDDNQEAEIRLLDTMKKLEIKADIDFYNMLIKKRCLRSDYVGAFDVKNIILAESKFRKKKYRLKKKLRLNMNVMTYGTLALACRTKEQAEELLSEMKEHQLKVNIVILGTLLRQGTTTSSFGYILYVMNVVKQENIKVNDIFLKHLEDFNEKCASIIQNQQKTHSDVFTKAYRNFTKVYNDWLKQVDIQEALKPEHPWAQFQEPYPETVQRTNFEIKEPKKFYKRKRSKYVAYKAI